MTRLALARSSIDRAARHRGDAGWLEEAWLRAQVLLVEDGRARVGDGPERGLLLLEAADAPAGERLFLGVDAAETPYFAVVGTLPPGPAATLREVGATLSDRDAGLFTHALALANWHTAHVRCPRCGAATEPQQAGHLRRCIADGSEHYPRTDPAVIMLVYDDADRCLLGHGVGWPPLRHSVLAGFVEPGESLEQAVIREVLEEVGVAVTDVRYVASQAWPFPSSLMLGFTARALVAELKVDQDEIESAAWFDRTELRRAVESGDVVLPPPVSIARVMIDDWLSATAGG